MRNILLIIILLICVVIVGFLLMSPNLQQPTSYQAKQHTDSIIQSNDNQNVTINEITSSTKDLVEKSEGSNQRKASNDLELDSNYYEIHYQNCFIKDKSFHEVDVSFLSSKSKNIKLKIPNINWEESKNCEGLIKDKKKGQTIHLSKDYLKSLYNISDDNKKYYIKIGVSDNGKVQYMDIRSAVTQKYHPKTVGDLPSFAIEADIND